LRARKNIPQNHGNISESISRKNHTIRFRTSFPYRFDIPDYAKIVAYSNDPGQAYWINISVPANKAEIHLSYYKLSNQQIPGRQLLSKFMEEAHTLAYKHTIKADAIQEQVFMNPGRNVYGLIYRIEGNAASPMQFF
jgi:gliding motility-associated lipoprotein GldD